MEKVKNRFGYLDRMIILHDRKGFFQSYDVVVRKSEVWVCGFFNPDVESKDALIERLKTVSR